MDTGQTRAQVVQQRIGQAFFRRTALYDRAFDQGLVTLNEDWRVILSTTLKKPEPPLQKHFHSVEGRKIELPERFNPDPQLMQYHREQVFVG